MRRQQIADSPKGAGAVAEAQAWNMAVSHLEPENVNVNVAQCIQMAPTCNSYFARP